MALTILASIADIQAALATRWVGWETRTTRAVAKALLLEGPYFYNGRLHHPAAKHIGAGVYKVFLEKSE